MSMPPAAAVAGLWIVSALLGTALAHVPLRGRVRTALAVALAPMPMFAPFLLVGQPAWVRFLVAVQSALCAMRVFDLCAGQGSDAPRRGVLADFFFAAFWWPSLERSAMLRRFDGDRGPFVRSRASRAAMFGVIGVVLLALVARLDLADRSPPAYFFLGACEVYLLGTALNDTVVAAFAFAGYWLDDLFDYPIPPRSLLDFWGRRDLVFHRWLKKHIFRPLARRRRPALGVLAVFAFSGLGHEYLILASEPELLGLQLAFFLLNGAGCLVEAQLSRAYRARHGERFPAMVQSTLDVAFLVAVSPLLFHCVDKIFQMHESIGPWILRLLAGTV